MTERIQNHSDDDNFSPRGFEGNPSLYGEEQLMHDYSTMATPILEDKLQRFIRILNNPESLPNHKKQVARLIDMIHAETTYRDVVGRQALESDFVPEGWNL